MPDPHAKLTCRLVRAGQTFTGKQGLDYAVGISAEAAGATGIHMQLVTIPPLTRARAHRHEAHETAIYTLGGSSDCWYGDMLDEHVMVGPGDFFYIPAGVPHLPGNPSETVPYVAVIVRTDPNEQGSAVLLADLDAKIVPKLDVRLRDGKAAPLPPGSVNSEEIIHVRVCSGSWGVARQLVLETSSQSTPSARA